uniref:Protein kinase domain-containing protein n=1 Tax=Meloidogyne hapla TaxID=6305 RepID=A0A1I8BPK5_MELHA
MFIKIIYSTEIADEEIDKNNLKRKFKQKGLNLQNIFKKLKIENKNEVTNCKCRRKGLLGEGATAKVFHLYSNKYKKCVAIKKFNEGARDEFIKEINIMKQINKLEYIIHEIYQ